MWPSSQDMTVHAAGLGSLRGSMEGYVVYSVHRLHMARAGPHCPQSIFVHCSHRAQLVWSFTLFLSIHWVENLSSACSP